MEHQENTPGRVTVKVKLGVRKTHGPNSPDVISGRVPLGHVELIQDDETLLSTTEVNYEQACQFFGREMADQLFNKGGEA